MRVSLPGPATHVACGMRHSLAVLGAISFVRLSPLMICLQLTGPCMPGESRRCAATSSHAARSPSDHSQFAQLGNALTEPCASPQLVRGLPREPLVSISAGARHSACVSRTSQNSSTWCALIRLTGNGCVYTFGNNRHGQLGVDPALTAASATPVHVKELDGLGVKRVQCGWHHCIAVTGNRSLLRHLSGCAYVAICAQRAARCGASDATRTDS